MSDAALSTICLVMIVRDEAPLIESCLAMLWPHIDAWVIADTGSVDGTPKLIESWTAAASPARPGRLVHHAWQDFGTNRGAVLAEARAAFPAITWQFMFDADDVLHVSGNVGSLAAALMPGARGASLVLRRGALTFQRTTVFATACEWSYVGVLHEYPQCAPDTLERPLQHVTEDVAWIDSRAIGARARNPATYASDARVLERAIEAEPDGPCARRYMFYAAQSWWDAGHPAAARKWYAAVARDSGAWVEERYIACVWLVRLASTPDDARAAAWSALALNPARREAAHALMCKLRTMSPPKWCHEALAHGLYVRRLSAAVPPPTCLFIELASYGPAYDEELGLFAYYLNQPRLAAKWFGRALTALTSSGDDTSLKQRLVANLAFAQERCAAAPVIS
jgi:hypothetical protein